MFGDDAGGRGRRVWQFSTAADFKERLVTRYDEQDYSGGTWMARGRRQLGQADEDALELWSPPGATGWYGTMIGFPEGWNVVRGTFVH